MSKIQGITLRFIFIDECTKPRVLAKQQAQKAKRRTLLWGVAIGALAAMYICITMYLIFNLNIVVK